MSSTHLLVLTIFFRQMFSPASTVLKKIDRSTFSFQAYIISEYVFWVSYTFNQVFKKKVLSVLHEFEAIYYRLIKKSFDLYPEKRDVRSHEKQSCTITYTEHISGLSCFLQQCTITFKLRKKHRKKVSQVRWDYALTVYLD